MYATAEAGEGAAAEAEAAEAEGAAGAEAVAAVRHHHRRLSAMTPPSIPNLGFSSGFLQDPVNPLG